MAQLKGGTTIAGFEAWHSGNMGPGSGLNADLLDGKEASEFASSTHTHAVATTSANGLMSKEDKVKVDSIANKADTSYVNTELNKKINTTRGLNFKSDHTTDWPSAAPMSGKTYMGGWHGNLTSGTSGYIAIGASGSNTLDLFVDGDIYAKESQKVYHTGNKPTKADVGLGNVTNESKATMFTNAALTGTPTAPTAAQTVNNTQIATTAFVKTAVAALVNSAPGTLDTLKELATALGNDPNFATTITNKINSKSDKTYVDSNFTMKKPSTIAAGADLNTLYASGLYSSGADGDSANLKNRPPGTQGFILQIYEVWNNGSSADVGSRLIQVAYMRSVNEIYMRDKSENAAWTAWKKVSGSTNQTLTRGSYLTGSNYNGTSATTWAVDATSANTANKVVARDGSGNFAAGHITATKIITGEINTTGRVNILNGGSAQGVNAGSLLLSSAYADATKVPANGLFATGNILTRGNMGVGYTHSDTTAPTVTLALGDSDTGFKWISDGVFDLYSNNTQVFRVNAGSAGITMYKPFTTSAQIKSTVAAGTAPLTVTSNTVVTNLNSDLLDGLHSSSFFRRDAANDVNIRLASTDGRGLRFWDSDQYTIYMSGSSNTTYGGRVAGETTSDYNMYFKMAGGTNRGFVFKNGTNNVAGIDASGNMKLNGDITAGNNKFKIKYDSTSETINFSFV